MFGNIEANVESYRLELYRDDLYKARDKMQQDIEALKKAYTDAQWNDMVSEKVRIQLNEYIDAYNRAIEELSSVISAVSEMCQELDDYENAID